MQILRLLKERDPWQMPTLDSGPDRISQISQLSVV